MVALLTAEALLAVFQFMLRQASGEPFRMVAHLFLCDATHLIAQPPGDALHVSF